MTGPGGYFFTVEQHTQLTSLMDELRVEVDRQDSELARLAAENADLRRRLVELAATDPSESVGE